MIVRKDTASRIPVVLVDSSGNPVTGLTTADLNDSSGVGSVALVKSDGAVTSIVLVDSSTFFEVDATKTPGLYHVLLSTGALDTVGQTQLVVQPDAAAFVGSIVPFMVEEYHLATKVALNRWKIFTIGPDANRLVLYDDDGTTVIKKFDLTDAGGSPTTSNPLERAPV